MDQLVIDNIIQMVKTAIEDVVKSEGEIRSMHAIGNSIYIKFVNGNHYCQPLIGKYTDGVSMD